MVLKVGKTVRVCWYPRKEDQPVSYGPPAPIFFPKMNGNASHEVPKLPPS